MNSNEISCFIDMFSAYQKVTYGNDGQEERIPLNDLPNILPQVCFSENFDKIHLYGDAMFCNGIADKIRMSENTTYGQNKIEIEVN